MLKALIVLLIIEELVSIAIYCIMRVYDGFDDVISNLINKDYYHRREDIERLSRMAFAGGWLFALYFIYLAYKWMRSVRKQNENFN